MKFQQKKRQIVFEKMKNNSIAILTAGAAIKQTGDEYYPFSVNRNFYYLTGIDEADVILVLIKGDINKEIIYIKKSDPYLEKWVGKTITSEEAKQQSLCQIIRYINTLNRDMKRVIKDENIKYVYIDDEYDPIIHQGRDLLNTYNAFDGLKVLDIYPIITELRKIKEPEEIESIREAINVTNEGLLNMINHMKPNIKECELEAYFNQTITKHQLEPAFVTIAAGGKNATVLHYTANNNFVNDNEMILFDLGVQKNRLVSDISRTYPINGKFTKRQREIYDIVLRTQELVFKSIKPGVSIMDLQRITLDSYRKELKNIGLIKEGTDEEVKKYYWHSISHPIGLDTHDVGVKRDEKLQPGMVISNEPGLYIEEEGIGIRIEDDILVTENGAENLSIEIIKDPDEIEELFKKR